MCGIMGWTTFTPAVSRMFPILADEMETRGSTSWGITNGKRVYKKLGSITTNFDLNIEEWESPAIIHTRAPSGGTSRGIDAAHPHGYYRLDHTDDNNINFFNGVIGIHNGFIASHDNLKNKYEDRKNFCVDSQHFFKHMLDNSPTTELTGSGAFAWFENKFYSPDRELAAIEANGSITYEYNILYLARFNNDALHIVKLPDGAYVFASTEFALRKAARLAGVNIVEHLTIKEDLKYKLESGVGITKICDMKFGRYSQSSNGGGYYLNGVYQAPGNPTHQSAQRPYQGALVSLTQSWSGKDAETSGVLSEMPDINLCPCCKGLSVSDANMFNPATMAVCEDCYTQWIDPYLTEYWNKEDGQFKQS